MPTKKSKAKDPTSRHEMQMKSILDSLNELVVYYDLEMNILWANAAACHSVGLSLDDLKTKRCWDVWGESDTRCTDCPVARAIETGISSSHEKTTNDGRSWLIKGDPVRDDDGVIVGGVETGLEITEERETRKILVENQRMLEEAQQLAHLGSWDWDVSANVLKWSNELYRIFGFEPGSIEPTDELFSSIVHPDDLEGVHTDLHRCLTTDELYRGEYRVVHSDGSGRVVYTTGEVHRNEKHHPIRFFGTVLDITERKRIETALNAERERLSVTLKSIGDAVISTDSDGALVFMNPIAEMLTGWSEDEAVGKPLLEIFNIVNEETREPCANPIQEVVRSGKVVGLANHTMLISRDGQEHIIADSGAPILDASGSIIGVVLVFRDITESQRIAADLQKMEKLRSLGVLAGGIAHDFNNFLTGIIGNISLVKCDLKPTNELSHRMDEIEKAALRAKDLTQQLLTFSRGGEPVKRLTHLDALAREASLFAIRGSNVRCHFDFPEALWPVRVDEGQIAQVIHNLIFNADQAMPEGGTIDVTGKNIALEQDLSLSLEPGEYVKLNVRDYGAGIKKEHLVRVFDPYFTTKQKGSGLGLAIAFAIIEKHSGHVMVSSELGVGTNFIIYLPASPNAEVETRPPVGALPTGSGRILVMDDEDSIRTFAALMLTKFGYEPALVCDGEEAIALFRDARASSQPFAAVILDLTVPGGMGGKETVKRLREIDGSVKAIVSSGYSNDPVISNYDRYGFKAAVKKPYLVQEMMRTLKTVLES